MQAGQIQSYLPALEVRPAEMLALQELPEKDKSAITPLFRLRPWATAHRLESALGRISQAFGARPFFLELSEPEPVLPGKVREVHRELAALRDPAGGFRNWCDFFTVAGRENMIPVPLLSDPQNYVQQVRILYGLGRGILVRIDSKFAHVAEAIVATTADLTAGGERVTLVLDLGKQGHKLPTHSADILSDLHRLAAAAPCASLVLCASSFPDGFTSIENQLIYERSLYEAIKSSVPGLVYSDRGSARAERQLGGGGAPAPRIDYATADAWHFFRDSSGGDRLKGYEGQAARLMSSPIWDKKLRLWGCQMIEKTAFGDETGITSANRATAARINIHIHQQIYYGRGDELYETDEDWVDI